MLYNVCSIQALICLLEEVLALASNTPRKYNLQLEFKDICEELQYDPSVELINRRNELAEEATMYEELANLAAEQKEEDPEYSKVGFYSDLAGHLKLHVEQIDLKLMPYAFARKAQHIVTDTSGNSIFEAFAVAVQSNLKSEVSVPATKHW